MYPKKKHHYFADFRLFIVFMGFYKLRIKEYEAAKQYYYLASKIDPSHKSVQRLKKQIVSQPFLLSSIVKKWFQGARKKRWKKRRLGIQLTSIFAWPYEGLNAIFFFKSTSFYSHFFLFHRRQLLKHSGSDFRITNHWPLFFFDKKATKIKYRWLRKWLASHW